jgi:nucleotide-binding universal stress UspA family protein
LPLKKGNVPKIESILLPTDFSEYSKNAMDYAVYLAGINKAKIYVLHVIEHIFDVSGFYIPNLPVNELYKAMEETAQEEIEKFIPEKIKEEIEVENIIISGTPFLEIIRTAREKKVDLIVISTHGRTGLEHVLFGSVAEKVVRKAPCSVFVVKQVGREFVMP